VFASDRSKLLRENSIVTTEINALRYGKRRSVCTANAPLAGVLPTPCFAPVPHRREIRGLQQDIVCDKLGVTQARTQLTAYGGATPGASARLGE
jgi:hypothetical protein